MSSWHLHDIRSWLLEASRTISRKWFSQQQDVSKTCISSVKAETMEEIEGRLVLHIFHLCDVLEYETTTKDLTALGKQRVVTPKTNGIDHLSIRWQHGHERGSGGAGGVGFSGIGSVSIPKRGRGSVHGRSITAGQIFRMKTAPQLKRAIGDSDAGEAFYKELRALVGRQDARSKQQRSKEASMRRMKQMRRKLELQSRVKL